MSEPSPTATPATILVPAWRSPSAWFAFLFVFGTGVALDLWSKAWAFEHVADQPIILTYDEVMRNAPYRVPYHEGIHALPCNLLDFRLVVNHGAVFGIGQNKRIVFVLFTIGAIGVALLVFARWTRATSRLAHVAIGLIVAGGVGNLVDRVAFGAVRDFLHIFPNWNLPFDWHWPGNATREIFPWVFNGADAMLLTGMALLFLYVHRRERAEKRRVASLERTVSAEIG